MKSYSVIIITALNKKWNDGWNYKAGLEKNGHTVIPFDPSGNEEAEQRVTEMVKRHRPDFILHTKDELRAETFQELRRLTKVIQWYPDPVVNEWLIPYVESADIFFTMSEGLVREFKKVNSNVFWLTQAYEPSFFKIGNVTERDRKTYGSDVTFIGNIGSKPQYLPRREFLQRVLQERFELKWWGEKIPRKISNLPLILGKLGRSYGGKFVYGEEYAKIARLSKIFLGFDSQPHVRKSMSERMYYAVGCGAFYMCQWVEGIEEVLEPDKEIVTFSSEQEMIDMIRYFLKNDVIRQNIAEAGQKRVLKEHTYEVRMQQMVKVINDVF